jgi:hypothetical protein
VSERRTATHHEFLRAAGAGGLDACAAPIRALPHHVEPLAPGWFVPVHTAVCDECDVAIEVWERDGLLMLRQCYPYRRNLRVGKRKRKGD